MKILCPTCGCHFPEEFDETLKVTCNFWGQRGASNMPIEWKKKIWDWQFSFDFDELAGATGIQLISIWELKPVEVQNTFAAQVDGWDKMTDQERRAYEKKHFKEHFQKQAEEAETTRRLVEAAKNGKSEKN